MTIKVSCNWCAKEFQVDEKFIWKKWTCPQCQTTFEIQAPSEEQKTQEPKDIKIHEQKISPIKEERTWLFSTDNLSKITGLIVAIIIVWWNAYGFFHNKKVDAAEGFVSVYNVHILWIQQGISDIQTNISSVQSSLIEAQSNESLAEEALKRYENIWDLQAPIYTKISSDLDSLENDACLMLKTSSTQCIEFIKTYRLFIDAIKKWDTALTEKLVEETEIKSDIFKKAALKDGIELW